MCVCLSSRTAAAICIISTLCSESHREIEICGFLVELSIIDGIICLVSAFRCMADWGLLAAPALSIIDGLLFSSLWLPVVTVLMLDGP